MIGRLPYNRRPRNHRPLSCVSLPPKKVVCLALVDDIPNRLVVVAADVLDAIDPDLTEQVREDAAGRAIVADPVATVGMLVTLLRETYEALADLTGVPAAEYVRRLRQKVGARTLGSDPPDR